MTLLVDYRCPECGARSERWVQSPPPGTVPCVQCGAAARRLWSPVRLGGRATSPAAVDRRSDQPAAASAPGPTLCQQYPQIPALCMMTPSAQRRMVAAYNGDHRARDREIERQAVAAAQRPPSLADAIDHHHQHQSA